MRVLLIEDNPGDARLIREMLREGDNSVSIDVAEKLSSGLEFLASNRVEFVLLDLGLPDSQGMETLIKLNEKFPHLPLIIMTSINDEALGVEAVKLGAQDYLVKGQVDGRLLRRSLLQSVERKKMEDALKSANMELKAARDELQRYSMSLESMVNEKTRELVESNERLRRAEKMEAISMMGAMMAHDLRGPLNLISQSVQSMNIFPERRERLLKMVKENADRALSMIEEVRQETKEIELHKRETDLRALIEKALKEAKIPESVQLSLEFEGDLSRVVLDPDVFRRVLDNLVNNAVDAMPVEGKLGIKAALTGGSVVLEVSDSGKGISEESAAKIWEPFHSSKQNGLGLGLQYCKRSIEAHGGSIGFVSRLGEGTTFTVKLPQ